MKKSSRTTMNYIGIIIMVLVVMVMVVTFSDQQSVGASVNHESNNSEELFEEGPHDQEEVSDTATSFVRQNVAGRTVICCYVNPLYQEITRDHHNARSLVNMR